MRSGWLVGPMMGLYGLVHAHANRFRRRANAKERKMTVTYGLNFSGSSESAALQQFLASKLQARTALRGSTMFKLIWKVRITPLGRLIYALRASALSTSAKGFTSWRTPKAGEGMGRYSRVNGKDFPSLFNQAQLSTWPTPRAEERQQVNSADNYQALSKKVQLTSWATPTTPRAHDSDNTAGKYYRSKNQKDLDYQAMLSASGPTPTGSTAVMISGGQLNPGLSRWLMGYPIGWDMCAPEKVKKSLARSKRKPSAALGGSGATVTP